MYIRKKQFFNAKNGKTYSYYQLIESRKTDKGTRNVVLLHIGALDITPEEQKIISTLVDHRAKGKDRATRFSDKIEKLAEQIYIRYTQNLKQPGDPQLPNDHPEQITFTKESLEMGFYRCVGAELISLHFWAELKFDEVFKECGFDNKQIELAKLVILGRLISPGSERHTIRWFNKQSSLAEFSRLLRSGVQRDIVYRIADKILASKDAIESKLRRNLKRLNSLVDKVYLYDLTNFHFEGSKLDSELCKRGKSKQKRDDCPLVTLALVVDQDAFPVYSKIYRGNQSEPATLPEILQEVYDNKEDIMDRLVKPYVIMDRGIATSANIAYLREHKYSYFVVERRDTVKDFGECFSDLSDFEEYETSDKNKVYLKRISDTDRTKVLVYSTGKAFKETGITGKRELRFLEDANKIISSNSKGRFLNADKILLRIGRLLEKYGSIAGKYKFDLQRNAENPQRIELIELQLSGKTPTKSVNPGCYVIETDALYLKSKVIWDFYMKLVEVESSFKAMKSELGTRPIFHKKDYRIEAHLFFSVLAYAIMKSITYKLQQKDYRKSWTEIKHILSTHMRSSVMFKDLKGSQHHIRQTGTPEAEAKQIYDLLGITIAKNQVHTISRK